MFVRGVGIYRFWRDMGYFAGGLIAGVAADAIDYSGAIVLVAAPTAASGVWVMVDMPSGPAVVERKQARPPRRSAAFLSQPGDDRG